MAVKTFTSGEVLTASDTNTYLNNGGLVYIKSQTIGTAVTSVTVTNAFSADFDCYKIVVNGGAFSASTSCQLRIGTATANYYWSILYFGYNSAPGNVLGIGGANASNFTYPGYGSTGNISLCVEVNSPYLPKVTTVGSWYTEMVTTGNAGYFSGYLNDTTQHTQFVLLPSAGTMTGGTITVYGYRKA